MKKLIIYFSLLGVVFTSSCKKDSLNHINPNSPTPAASLTTEAGVTNFALGIINKQLANILNAGTTNVFVEALVTHSAMGDEIFQPYGNWGVRWANQVYKITLPNGTVVTNPNVLTQKEELQRSNNRPAGDRNSFQYEWDFGYFYIAQANTLLEALNNPALTFSGDAATKKGLLKAWALWWKGYAYSRIGSIYLSALIYNKTSFTPTGAFVTHDAIITEANKVLDEAVATLNTLSPNANYNTLYQAITPSFNDNTKVITPDMWKRTINTMKARNLLANKKVAAMTTADWNSILTLTAGGIQSGDNIFKQGVTSDGNNDVSAGGFFHPYIQIGSFMEFNFVSERLIQEYKTGDARLNKNFELYFGYPPNIRGRGLQFGTRWSVKNIESGGSFATDNLDPRALLPIAGSYEENELMKAEALIRLGSASQITQGLQIVDQVRTFQGANLAAVAGTGLTQSQALEEVRRERRVALFLRGVAFYDARRLGIIAPVSAGGGRAGAMVYLPAALYGGAIDDVRPCFMEYNYLDYFDVPQNEIDFNLPASGAAPVKN